MGEKEFRKVSIITVCFNSEKTIERAIKSVLNQTYQNIEYIIVDGKSTDNTLDIIKQYEPLFDGRMKIISEPDNGIYDAMNKGISYAKGLWIGILNSDDFYEKDAVEKIVITAQNVQTDYAILYGATRFLRNGVEDTVSLVSHHFLKERMISHPSCFVHKKVYQDFGVYDVNYVSVADYDFMLRMYQCGMVNFIPVYDIITNFRIGGMSASRTAYLDLLKLKRNYKMITKNRYIQLRLKDFICYVLKNQRV